MKQRITKALIKQHLGDDITLKRTLLVWPPWHAPGWQVSLPSGASVTITQGRIDFGKYRLLENRADIDEDKVQEEAWACLELGEEVWGGIGVYGDASQEDIAQFLNNVESAGIKTGDQGLVLRHFGPEATLRCHWRGWEVLYPDGRRVKVAGGAIEEVSGDAEIFRATLMLLNELAPEGVVVRGNLELILAGLQHGESLKITVIPEVIAENLYGMIAAAVQVSCILLALIWLNPLAACVIGWIAGVLVCIIANRVFWKRLRQDARRRGQDLKSKWPPVHGGDRKASFGDAKTNGLVRGGERSIGD